MTTVAGVFLVPNATFFAELVAVIILVVVLSKKVLPLLNKAMEDRREQIRASLEEAERARQEALAADDERQHVLEAARAQAREIVATAQQTADAVRNDAAARAQVEYDRIVDAATADLQLARQRAVDEAAARLGEIVMEVVSKIVGREINADSHRELIDEAIAALGEESRRGVGQTA